MVWLQSQLVIAVLPIITFHSPFGGMGGWGMKNTLSIEHRVVSVAWTDTVAGNIHTFYLLSLRFGTWGTFCF